ncbi:MAG: Stage V sporulation protein T [Firmicutes bacterium ADurb.Bin419]|nr:MAG: Stage V sporulation protein T [Firmicutes bacterium ADurb.Bin419]
MKTTGVTRKIDALGRIVLPMEIRQAFDINNNEPLEIYLDNSSIILKKYNPGCSICDNSENLISFKDKKFCRECISELAKKAGSNEIITEDNSKKGAEKKDYESNIFSDDQSLNNQLDEDTTEDELISETNLNSLIEDFSSYVENFKEDEDMSEIDDFEGTERFENADKSNEHEKKNSEVNHQNMKMEQYERDIEALREQFQRLKEKQERRGLWSRLFGSGPEGENKNRN